MKKTKEYSDIQIGNVRRRGKYISIAPKITAVEGQNGNMPTLIIRKAGKNYIFYRGNSLGFSTPHLRREDAIYLLSLAKICPEE